MRLDPGDRGRHREAEIRIGAELGVAQRTVERGGQQRARHLDRHAPADAVFARGPAGVDQPAIDIVHGDQFAQQVAVHGRMTRQERRAEAGGEFRLDADETLLGAGDLRGVAGEEVIHRLRRRELGDRRHHAERVGGEHHQVLRHAGAAAARGVRDELERIGRAGVLGLRTRRRNRRCASRDRTRHSPAPSRSAASRRRSPARPRATA